MSEHIKLTAVEAKARVVGLRHIVLDTYGSEISNHPFFIDLRAGKTLPTTPPRLDYCARIAVQMMAQFYDGIYKRYASP